MAAPVIGVMVTLPAVAPVVPLATTDWVASAVAVAVMAEGRVVWAAIDVGN